MQFKISIFCLLNGALFALSGCDRPGVVAYIAPVDRPAAEAAGLPEGWLRQKPGPMQLERYVMQREDGEWTEITVSKLAGDGGGLAANINRWRGQIGLPPLVDADAVREAEPATEMTEGAWWVDLAGTDERTQQPARTLVLILPYSGETWFYKITGHPEVSLSQREPTATFARTTRLTP